MKNKRAIDIETMLQMENRKKRYYSGWNWLISFAIILAVLVAELFFTDILYETNDDFAISQMILAGYPYVGFVNYYLCKALIIIQRLLPETNAFILTQMVLSAISSTVILKIYLDRRDEIFELIPVVLLIAFFSLDHYSSVQFTKTAALLMTAGLLRVVDNYINERRVTGFVFGFGLFWLGVAFRQKAMFPALSYAVFFIIVWYVLNSRRHIGERKMLGETGIIVLMLVMMLAPYGFDKLSDNINSGTPQLKYFREYQSERMLVTDYPLMNYFEQNADAYKAIGISYNDLEVIDRWMFDYDGAASLENLRKINEINRSYVETSRSIAKSVNKTLKDSWKSVIYRDFSGMHIIMSAIIAIYAFFTIKTKDWVYIIGFGVLSIAIYVAVFYMQRPQYRALYVAEESAAFWLLFTSIAGEKKQDGFNRALRILTLLICSIVIIAMIPNAIRQLDAMSSHNAGLIESQEVTDYFNEHQSNYYIGPTTTMRQPASYNEPLSIPLAPMNVTDTGGWETLSPYKLRLLSMYRVNNPIADLVDAENIYFFGDSKKDMLKEYYNKWYCKRGEYVEFVKVDEVDGNGIYSVVIRQ